eukprot:5538525-Pyramimonas_sp.AAC.1
MCRGVEHADGRTGRVPDSVSEPAPESAQPLLEAMRRAGTSGPGVDPQAQREDSVAVKPHESLVGFFNDRAVHKPQSTNKLKSAKNGVYNRESEDSRSGLRLARQDERGKWR